MKYELYIEVCLHVPFNDSIYTGQDSNTDPPIRISKLFSSEHSKILQKLLVIAILLNKRDLGFHNKYLRYSLMKLRNSFCTNMAVNALRENSEAETNLWTKCPAHSWATVLLSG